MEISDNLTLIISGTITKNWGQITVVANISEYCDLTPFLCFGVLKHKTPYQSQVNF